jgi:hypothetical protein
MPAGLFVKKVGGFLPVTDESLPDRPDDWLQCAASHDLSMFIELPHALNRSAELALELDPAFDEPQTLTAADTPRVKGALAASRIRLTSARDARSWPMHASVDAQNFEFRLTQG